MANRIFPCGSIRWISLFLLFPNVTPAGFAGQSREPHDTESPESRTDGAQDSSAAEPTVAQETPVRHFEPFPVRWFSPGRPVDGIEPFEYEINRVAEELNPYRQNMLKGDFPLPGTEDLFLNLIVTERFTYQVRELPTPSGITGSSSVEPDFFGDPDQTLLINDVAVTVELFKGQQAFMPVEWRIRVTPVFNFNVLDVEEVGVVKADVSKGTRREEADLSLQEAFVEYHLFDLSDRYDFVSVEAGVLPFRSDFRGFIFDDTNLGVRLLGNWDNNKWQYNLVYFDTLNKDTNSLLNEFTNREQEVYIANLYRQDWPVLGYTTQFSFHYNHDDRGFHFDENGFLVSPAPIGRAQQNEIDAYYLGWTGEGHLGRINVTHALYQALGEEDNNPFAARDVDIDAQLAALELSYDIDWLRLRVFGLYASGDEDTRDGDAEGFDAIFDAPNFAGGELSFFNSQAIRLLGVNLTNLGSPLPDLQSSKFEGQSNFVNPGIFQVGGALDFELTPKWRGQVGGNYLHFVEVDPLEVYLEIPDIDREIGTELFVGTQYRPLLNNHVNILASLSGFWPGDGFERIYQSDSMLFAATVTLQLTW